MITGLQILEILACFAIGAIPFAQIAMWGTGIDITKVGSKNPGFRNVQRVASKPRAIFTLAGDMGKGFVALLLFGRQQPSAVVWIMGLAAVIGHCWNPFLKWNGGKGAATTAGVMLFLQPVTTAVCLPLYPILRTFGRKKGWKQEGAISTLTTMAVISTSAFIFAGAEAGAFAYMILAVVIVRHISNLREILGNIGAG